MSDEPIELPTICVTPDGPCEEGDGAGGDGGGQLTGTARHAGNADVQWRAVTSYPDFCRVGDRIVGFDSSATLGTPVRHSPDVILAGRPAYRVGDLCRGIQGDAGSGLVSGTSGGSGHVRFLDGQHNVRVNGQPLVRDGNPCLINCNAAGVGGARGYVQTVTRGARSRPAGGGTPGVAERLRQQAGDVSQQADDLRQQLDTAPNGRTHAEALALQERVNQLNAEAQQLREALNDAARQGELRGDALNDALFDVEEATHRARDLAPEAERQVRYTSGAGQTARAIGAFGAETFTPWGNVVDARDTRELFATGQYGKAIGMTLLTAAGLIPGVRGVRKAAEGIDEIHDVARGADAAEEAAEGARRGEDAAETAGEGVHVESSSAGKKRSDDLRNPSRNKPASFGKSSTIDYKETFFETNPDLKGDVVVHHSVEQQVRKRYPGLVTESEMHSLENLRGIPKEINSEVHLSKIRKEWNRFYRQNPGPTKQQLLDKATEIDDKFGSQFKPPVRD